jgi:diacylglycerol kinase (ATP)
LSSVVPILMNSKAGLLKSTAGAPEMARMAEACEVPCKVIETSSLEEMRKQIRQLVDQKAGCIAVAGGDGTIHEAVQCLANTDTALGIIPQGTANNFANALRLPQDLPSALRVLRDGKVTSVDLGKVHGEFFTEAAGVGLFADALAIYGGANKNFFKGMYALLRILLSLKASRVKLTIDDETVHERAVFCAIANSYRMANSLPVAPEAKVTDGELDVVILGDLGVRELLPYYRALRSQLHLGLDKAASLKGKKIVIESRRRMPLHCDDRIVGTTPATITSHPRALKVMVERL